MELLWTLAATSSSVVIEANFRRHHARERDQLRALAANPVEVHCSCAPELAIRRYNERGPARHPVHVVDTLSFGNLAEYDGPVGVGRLVTVDTTATVDVGRVARAVRVLRGLSAGN